MRRHNKRKRQLNYFVGLNEDFYNHHVKKRGTYNKKIDVMYIDGSHEYEDVVLDLTHCDKMLKKNGIMILDDYDKRYADPKTKDPSRWCDGVKQAVDEFLVKNNDRYKVVHKRYQIIIKKVRV